MSTRIVLIQSATTVRDLLLVDDAGLAADREHALEPHAVERVVTIMALHHRRMLMRRAL